MLARTRLPTLAILALVVAGCLGGTSSQEDEDVQPSAAAPPGCDAGRPAVAHRPGGVPVEAPGPAPIPCLSKTGFNSREPTIGISARGTVFHYPAMTGDNAHPTGVAVTRDEGATWTLSLPSLAGQPTHVVSTDPYFFLDPTTGRIFADDLNVPNCSVFSWSDDEGSTWDHSYSGCLETDHQTIFAGRPVQSTTMGYPNVLYRCAINAVALSGTSTMTTCQRSLDGGRTWLPPGQPAFVTPTSRVPEVCDGAAGHGKTDASGRVYLPKGLCDEPWLAISADEGESWRRVRPSARTIAGHDAAVGVDSEGTIYYLFLDGVERLPYLTVSTDEGSMWSEPRMVAAPGVNEASQPEMIVGGAGRLAIVYMGTTNGPGAPFTGGYDATTWNAYIGLTIEGASPEPLFHSVAINDPVEDPFVVGTCGLGRCQGVQDFQDIRIAPDGTPWAALVDDCLGEGARCAEADEALDTHRVGAVGRLWGGPSLWDAEDPNGPY